MEEKGTKEERREEKEEKGKVKPATAATDFCMSIDLPLFESTIASILEFDLVSEVYGIEYTVWSIRCMDK